MENIEFEDSSEKDLEEFRKFFNETPVEDLVDLIDDPNLETIFNYDFINFIRILYNRNKEKNE